MWMQALLLVHASHLQTSSGAAAETRIVVFAASIILLLRFAPIWH